MSEPFQILCVSATPPELWGSAYGPFVLQTCATLDEAAAQLRAETPDAIWLDLRDPAPLLGWSALSHAVLDAAVVLTTPEPDVALATRLLQMGVQDVAPPTNAASLARLLRLAIERKRLEKAARKAYATDLSTGLPNHTQLLEHVTHLVALRAREPAPMALIVLRIEGLGALAEVLGAESTNVLRRKVAVRLRSALRASDVVASLGSDTFAVLLAWIDAADDGVRVAGKLAQSLTAPFTVTGRECRVRVSAGVASFPSQAQDAEGLLRRALGQAASMAPQGTAGVAHAADRGPRAAANDE
ncbi:MAG: GGDEF domain-containing protein [Rubrivivax sp.]|jgi:diguanylate cyclase (GGDEF)-like protein